MKMKSSVVLMVTLFACAQANGALKPRLPRIKPLRPVDIAVKAPAVIGGSEAPVGAFPFIVAIIQDNAYFCGGTLLTSQFIMTAAHCAYGISKFVVYAGTVDWSNTTSRLTYTTTTKTVHASYNNVTLENDIALIKLTSAISSTHFSTGKVALVRIPTQTQANAKTTFNYLQGTVAGWGLVSDTAESVTYKLRYATMTIINNTECAKVYGSIIKQSTICAYGKAITNICSGDSGGPLMVTESGSYTQVGITSFTASETCVSYPSGFARVTYYMSWLKLKVGTTLKIRS